MSFLKVNSLNCWPLLGARIDIAPPLSNLRFLELRASNWAQLVSTTAPQENRGGR
jgi:hypothetical protein